jgi:prolyl oligopeptidase
MRSLLLLTLLSAALGCGGEPPRAPSTPAPAVGTDFATTAAVGAEELGGPPVAPARPTSQTYHGTAVSDPYQWLERGDSEVRAWSQGQNAYTRKLLDALPNRAALTARVRELIAASPDWQELNYEHNELFALESRPPKQQPYLVVMDKPDPASARVVLDPNTLDASGGTSIDWYVPSDDAKLVAISLSLGGSESGTVHVFDTASGKERPVDRVPRVHGGTAGGSLAWNQDASGFWYTRYPHAGERPEADLDFYQQVYFHRLGQSTEKDQPSLVEGLPKIAEIALSRSLDGRWVLAQVKNGDGGEFLHFVLDAKASHATWAPLARLEDEVVEAKFGPAGGLWLLSHRAAPKGQLLKLDPAHPDLARAERVVPEGDATIGYFEPTKERLYLAELVGGPYQLRVLDLSGHPKGNVPLAALSSVRELVKLQTDDVLFRSESYLEAPAWFHWDAKQSRVAKTALAQTPSAHFDDSEVVRETCRSKDGTEVPLNVLRRKGTRLDGSTPVLLYGYGGYGVSESPRFVPMLRLWLDQGGVYAAANLRGGGEFGETWHRGGNLTNKQHVFDDFLACANHVIEAGYTRPERLAILGGSNGGLLMGAALTQAPQLFRAVVARVGIFDMLRVELTPNGLFNVTEFGTVQDEAQFRALYAYSPYHHVEKGVSYPATLFMTGENDPRVAPYNSRKMVARLQAANGTKTPILLRTSGNTGHGRGTPLDARIEEQVDLWGFLFWQLGMSFGPTASASEGTSGAPAAAPGKPAR